MRNCNSEHSAGCFLVVHHPVLVKAVGAALKSVCAVFGTTPLKQHCFWSIQQDLSMITVNAFRKMIACN